MSYSLKAYYFSEECIICFYPLSNEEIAQVDCGHIYHHKCIKKWLKVGKTKKCPMCNTGEFILYKKDNSLLKNICCCFYPPKQEPLIKLIA